MFEIWQHIGSGQRYLVMVREGRVHVAAGPLDHSDDPRRVLATHGNQEHNALALLDMHRHPAAYRREYTTEAGGHVVQVAPAAEPLD